MSALGMGKGWSDRTTSGQGLEVLYFLKKKRNGAGGEGKRFGGGGGARVRGMVLLQ